MAKGPQECVVAYHAAMTTIVVTYRFTRDPVAGFFRQNTASTDALNVLIRWAGGGGGRTYEVLEDGEERLVVRVSLQASDQSAAMDDINRLCREFGVTRDVTDD